MNFKRLLETQGEKLKSQSNDTSTVMSDNTKAIRKRYSSGQAMSTEISTTRLLQTNGVAVASVMFTQGNTVIFEQIEGITYDVILERIEQGLLEERSIKRAVNELCLWLDDYYAATRGAYRGDVNFKNFILTPFGKCVSIDFSEPLRFGRCEYDMGRMIACVATYDPPFTIGKTQMCKALIENFLKMDADIEEIKKQYDLEIDEIKLRRAGFSLIEQEAREFWTFILK